MIAGFDLVSFLASWTTMFGIYAILALTLSFESGTAGVVNFGKVAFYGVGAYVGALASTYLTLLLGNVNITSCPPYSVCGVNALLTLGPERPDLSLALMVLSLVLAFLLASSLGYLLSYPILRVGPAFVGFTLLSFGEILRIFFTNFELVGASAGLMAIPTPFNAIQDPRLRDLSFSALVWAVAGLTYVVIRRATYSPLGRTLRALRDDEVAALCLGKHVPGFKAKVLFLGSGFSGVAGALLAYYMTAVNPGMFVPAVTFDVWAMAMLGGMGNPAGALLGAALLTLVDRTLRFLVPRIGVSFTSPDYLRWIFTGLLMIVILLYKPRGILPERSSIERGEGG
ncbi:MAG: branched-chain amino acid ABC transporter permease [Desulfurococcaceae archaeon]